MSVRTALTRARAWSRAPRGAGVRRLTRGDLKDLDQVPAGVIQDGRGGHPHVGRLHRELHAQVLQAGVLLLDVIDLEGRERNPVRTSACLSAFISG